MNAYTTTGANGTELNIDAIEALKEDPLYDAFKEDGSPKTGWRDLTEDDILGLVGSLDNLATKDGDVYTLNDDVFTPPNIPPSLMKYL